MQQNDAFSLIYQHILSRFSLEQRVAIGVNGLDCAGKTFFASKLADYLEQKQIEVELIHVDDFNNDAFQAEFYETYIANGCSAIDLSAYYESSVDYTLLRQAIEKAKCSSKVMIVEGVFLYKPVLTHLFSFKLFIEVDFALALERYASRREEVCDKRPLAVMQDIWIPTFERYVQVCEPNHQADLVVKAENLQL